MNTQNMCTKRQINTLDYMEILTFLKSNKGEVRTPLRLIYTAHIMVPKITLTNQKTNKQS